MKKYNLYSRAYLFAKSFAFFLKAVKDLSANDFAHGYNKSGQKHKHRKQEAAS